ncbi:HutD/Ves family protein [Tardiphaga sp. vice278]|uniref:HutD/Ves family protein n=1 Tax=Tardiphaga sp. vice278 TaxID=2592815 RepID=UPI001161D702|nr:HutD family protein [Tardiphaga sp. vice278]QDM15643.1 HutD family protein [Tardiphaga sp. vice278]
MRLLRASDRLAMPWKNGGGSTTKIAIGPAGASLESFDWRISMAEVATDGPFSMFDGIDRTLAVIQGSGMELKIGEQAAVVLGCESAPLSFPGDTPTTARLLAGEITDLNVMTRRGRFGHRVIRITHPMDCRFDGDDVAIVLSLDGTTGVTVSNEQTTLQHADAVTIEAHETPTFQVNPAGQCYLIWLSSALTA